MTVDVLRGISLHLAPATWHEAFDGLPVAGSLLVRMLQHERRHLLLLDGFAEKRNLPPRSSLPVLGDDDRRLLLAPATDIQAALALAGLSCWGHALATEVDGARLRTLHASFGRDALMHARRWKEATPQLALPTDLGGVASMAECAGRACMHAWLAALPQAWYAWIAVTRPDWCETTQLPDGMQPHAVAIWRDAMEAAAHGS